MSNSKETNKNSFKEATKNLLHAGKNWVETAIQTGSDQYTNVSNLESNRSKIELTVNVSKSHPFSKESRCEARYVA